MELKLISTKDFPHGIIINNYVVGNYSVTEHKHNSYTCIYLTPNMEANDFLPGIYAEDDLEDGNITNFLIQTTSYGALSVEDTQKFIEAYEEAVKVVKILKNKFVTKDK